MSQFTELRDLFAAMISSIETGDYEPHDFARRYADITGTVQTRADAIIKQIITYHRMVISKAGYTFGDKGLWSDWVDSKPRPAA